MSDQPKTLDATIRAWLNKGGYPLEMRTARAFGRAGLVGVQQSEFYKDPDTGKSREIDVLVTRSLFVPARAALAADTVVTVGAVVECKQTTDKPWIAFSADRTAPDTVGIIGRALTKPATDWLQAIPSNVKQQAPLLRLDPHPCYGLVQAHTDPSRQEDQRDLAFAALVAAAKAADHQTRELDADRKAVHVAVHFPIVVISGSLCRVRLNAVGNDVDIEEVDRVQVRWRNPLVADRPILIDVITERALPVLSNDLSDTCEHLLARSDEAQEAARQVWTRRPPMVKRLR